MLEQIRDHEGTSISHARLPRSLLLFASIAFLLTGTAKAGWKAANEQVNDRATFASFLAPDLVSQR
ncbi:hypothetical protein [Terriglobus saanensis]|uniref:Serine/threonine protein kinase n=1 Tax=Terriglobus saanensis (strain ATCC BAA-1853 / DSM 23119 / SP1PR4) TaxID=401053 RepID=E8UY47_TERSS|nr:hypothetical protein [Terriglobus saanensis]ADV80857.1 serine/threonine protein kinase [Terriglobus saanensis SP1PR4]